MIRKSLKVLCWLLPLVAISTLFFLFYSGYVPIIGSNIEERGQFGDSFGVLNSLFTGLGFGGLIITITLQQKQINQQDRAFHEQRKSDDARHYEDTLHRLIDLYSKALLEVASSNGSVKARNVLRDSTRRALSAIRKEGSQSIPLGIQDRYDKSELTVDDELFLDYLYFRNFKILNVEIDRQGRLIETFKNLLRHLVTRIPPHMEKSPYLDIVTSQITVVELSYFYFVALAFKNENELRELMLSSKIINRAAYIKRLKIHDCMYETFWGVNIRTFKEPVTLPMNEIRISKAIKAHRTKNSIPTNLKLNTYTSPRVTNIRTNIRLHKTEESD